MAGSMLFEEIMKFNPYHDARGRFSTSGAYTSFTYSPGKSKAHDLAIQREQDRTTGRMPTEAQAKALKGIETKTRNLKKEQYRVVDREGNVVMQKQGDAHSVSYTIGEARDHIPGNITIHNHPDGGTFSSADLSDIGHGATEIRAAAPEGTYVLRNARYGGKYNAAKEKTWYDMRDDIDSAAEGFKTHRQIKSEVRKPFDEQLKPYTQQWEKRKAEGADWDELNKIAAEYTAKADSFRPQIEAAARKAYVDQYHHWYQANAGNYGLEYEFIPVKTRTKKSSEVEEMIETIGKSGEKIVLDRKMNQDVKDLTDTIIEEIKGAIPVQKSDNQVSILKTDDDKRVIFGWASVAITVDGEQLVDRQQDMIDPEDLEEAAYEYVLNFRDTGEEHIPSMRKKGKLVESCVFTEEKQRAMGIPPGVLPVGWWIGFKIFDDDAWAKVKNGTYRMFSVEGRAQRVPVEKSEQKERGSVAKTFQEITGTQSRFDTIVEKSTQFDTIVEKFNPYHDSKGRFASAHGAASFTYAPGKSKAHDMAIARMKEAEDRRANRTYATSSTKDAADQIKDESRYTIDGKKNSLDGFLDENGNLTPEREAVHREIIDKLLTGKEPVQGQATMTMLGGGPASGKSSVMNPDTSKDKHAVTIDPDMMKSMLPGYAELAKTDTRAADFFHEESSMLAKRFAATAYSENYNAVFDGTGDGSNNSVRKKIQEAKAAGYRVEAKYVSIDTEEAVRRNQKRYDDAVAKGETPRLPPVEMVVRTHTKCTDISVAMAPEFDHIEIWDNNGAKGQQKMIATGGGGKGLKAVSGQGASFDRYLSKGAKGLEGFITLGDGTVIPAE